MASTRLDFDVNFRTRGNFNQLNSSLNKLRYGVDRAAGAFETPAINVANPINELSEALGKNRLTFRQFGQVVRNSNRILDEHNAIASATGKVFKDAAGNAQVFLDVNRVMYRDTATASQRMRLYATAISGASQSLINLGKNIQWAGRQVMIGITLPLVAAGRQAVRFAERYDREMTRVVKVTNLATHRIKTTLADGTKGIETAFDVTVQTEEMRERLELAAKYIRRQTQDLAEFGANLGFLSYKTAEAAAEFAQMGYAGNALSALTKESLTLSRVSGTELLTSVQLVRLAVQAFGNDISSLEETFARLNMVENNTALALNEMATAIPIVASVANNLGITIERLAGFLAIMKEKGIAASEGATALRTGLIRLIQSPTRNAAIAFERINLSLEDMQERHRGDVTGFLVELAQTLDELSGSGAAGQRNVEAFTQALSTLTGVRASARFLSLVTELKDLEKVFSDELGEEIWRIRDGVSETAPIVRALIGEFTDSTTALAVYRYELERVNQSLAGTSDRLRAQLSVEIQKIGRRFLVVSNQLREFGVQILRAFNNLTEGAQNTVFAFGVVLAAVGPLAMILGVLANALGQIISFFSKFFRKITIMTTAQRAEELAFSATNREIEYQVALKNSLVAANSRLSASSAALAAATLGLRPGKGQAPGFVARTKRYPGKEVYDSVYQDILKGIKKPTGAQKTAASLTATGSGMAAVVAASLLKILPGADMGRLTQSGSEVGVSMIHDFFEGMQHQWEKDTKGFIADKSLLYPRTRRAPGSPIPTGSWTQNPNAQLMSLAWLSQFREFDREASPTTSDIGALARSIQGRGFDDALVLEVFEDGRTVLIEGNHRLAAAQRLGLDRVPVRVVTSSASQQVRDAALGLDLGLDPAHAAAGIIIEHEPAPLSTAQTSGQIARIFQGLGGGLYPPSQVFDDPSAFPRLAYGEEYTSYLPLGYGIDSPERIINQQIADLTAGMPRSTLATQQSKGILQLLREEYATLEAEGRLPLHPQAREGGRFLPGPRQRFTFEDFVTSRIGRRPPDISDPDFVARVSEQYYEMFAEGTLPMVDIPAQRGPDGRFLAGATRRAMTLDELLRRTHHEMATELRPPMQLPLFSGDYIYPIEDVRNMLPQFVSEDFQPPMDFLFPDWQSVGITGPGFTEPLPLLQGMPISPLGPGLLPDHLRKQYPIDDTYMRYFARMATSPHPGASMGLGGRVVDAMQMREALGLAPTLAAGTTVRGIAGWAVAGNIQDDFQVTMNEILYQAAAQQRLGVGGKTIVDDAMNILEDHITMQMRSPQVAAAVARGEGDMVNTMFDRMRQSVGTRLQYFTDPKMPARFGYYKEDPITGQMLGGGRRGFLQGRRIPFLTQQRLDGLMGRTAFEAPPISRAQMNDNLRAILENSYAQMEREGRAPDVPMDVWVSRGMKKQTGLLSRLREFRTVTGGMGLREGQALQQGMTPFLTGAQKGATAGLNWNKLLLAALIMPIKGPFMAIGEAFKRLTPKVVAFGNTLAKSGGLIGKVGKFMAGGAGLKAGVMAGLAMKMVLPLVIVFGAIAMSSPKDFMKGMKDALEGPLAGLKDAWQGFMNQINRLRLAFSSVGGEAGSVAAAIAKWFGSTLGNVFGAVIRIVTAILNIFQSLFKLIETIALFLRGDFLAAFKGLKDFAGLLGSALLNTISSILGAFLGWIPGFGRVTDAISGVADKWTSIATATDYATEQLLVYKGVLSDVNSMEKEFQRERGEIEDEVMSMARLGLLDYEDLSGMSAIWEGFDRFSASQEEEAERIRETIQYVEENFGGLPDEMQKVIVAYGMLNAEAEYFNTITSASEAAASSLQAISEQASRGFLGRFSRRSGAQEASRFLELREQVEQYDEAVEIAQKRLEDYLTTGIVPDGVLMRGSDAAESLQMNIDDARRAALQFRTENADALSAPFANAVGEMRPAVEAVGRSIQSEVSGLEDTITRMTEANFPLRSIAQQRNRLAIAQNALDRVNVALLGDASLMADILLEYSQGRLANQQSLNERIEEQISLEQVLAAQKEAEDVDPDPDYSEYISAMQSAMQEVMGDITTSVSNILRNQESMITEHFSNIGEATANYFSQYSDRLREQTEEIRKVLRERNQAELDAINSVADAQIEAIEEIAKKEAELDRKRKEFFDRENARIEYLRRRRVGEVEIRESILRGELGRAAIQQIERDLAAQEYYNKILQDREEDLRRLREEAREEEIERINDERDEAIKAAEDMLGLQETLLQESIDTSEKLGTTYERLAAKQIEEAQKAADEATKAEQQRIQNYLREWQRNIPASEAEFARHQKALQAELDRSASNLAGIVNGINSDLNKSLASLSSQFVNSNNTIMTELEIGFVDVERQYLSSSNAIIKSMSDANVTVTNSVDNMLKNVGSSAFRVETQLVNVRNRFYSEMSGLLSGLGSTITNTEHSMTGSFMGIDTKYGELAGNLDLTSADIRRNFADASADLTDRFSTALGTINSDLERLNDENTIRIDETLHRFLNRTVPDFTSGLSEGFADGNALVKDFVETFERDIDAGFTNALRIAIEQFIQKEKWERAGADIMEAIQRGIDNHPLKLEWEAIDNQLEQAEQRLQAALGWHERRIQELRDQWRPILHPDVLDGIERQIQEHEETMERLIANYERRFAAIRAGVPFHEWVAQNPPTTTTPPPTTTTPPPTTPTTPSRQTVSTRTSGPNSDVRLLQQALNRFANAGLEVDGYFGEQTRLAVVAYQRNKRLAPDGIAGPNTWSALQNDDIRAGRPLRIHTGGLVGSKLPMVGGGYSLKSDEISAVLQKGEYVINKSAVSALGVDFLERLNGVKKMFSAPAVSSVSVRSPGGQQVTQSNNYHLSFEINGANIDEADLARKVVFEIKKMERSTGQGRRVVSQ